MKEKKLNNGAARATQMPKLQIFVVVTICSRQHIIHLLYIINEFLNLRLFEVFRKNLSEKKNVVAENVFFVLFCFFYFFLLFFLFFFIRCLMLCCGMILVSLMFKRNLAFCNCNFVNCISKTVWLLHVGT